jgi:N-acetylglucosaminyldiphosphoundecaprenol N-acetyl-beta-D-mannosaminyltransferase
MKTTNFLGLNFFIDSPEDLMYRVVENSRGSVIHFVAASTLSFQRSNPEFFRVLENGIVICDSQIVKFLAWLSFRKISRIRGTDFVRTFFQSVDVPSCHFVYGSTNSSLEAFKLNISKQTISQQKIDFYSPLSSNNTEFFVDQLQSTLRMHQYDYLWIALGSPKQDLIAQRVSENFNGVIFCVGAAIDFISEHKREAPKFLQDIGLEWLFRWYQEPFRLFKRYTRDNARFIQIWIKWVYLVARNKVNK